MAARAMIVLTTVLRGHEAQTNMKNAFEAGSGRGRRPIGAGLLLLLFALTWLAFQEGFSFAGETDGAAAGFQDVGVEDSAFALAPSAPSLPVLPNLSADAFELTLATFDRKLLRSASLSAGEALRNPWDDQSPVAVAIAVRDTAQLQQILESNADPNEPLSTPVSSTYVKLLGDDVIGFFLNKDSGLTPLMVAAGTNQPDAVRLLLKHGAKPLARTVKYRMYPLDFAAQRTRIETMQLLLGRDPKEQSEERKIVISLSNQRAFFWRNGKIVLSSPVSTGRRGYTTPAGEYVITQKYRDWKSTIYKVPMPNFMRLNSSSIGLHAGNVNSSRASHGCIRLPHDKSRSFFAMARTGDRVTIVE